MESRSWILLLVLVSFACLCVCYLWTWTRIWERGTSIEEFLHLDYLSYKPGTIFVTNDWFQWTWLTLRSTNPGTGRLKWYKKAGWANHGWKASNLHFTVASVLVPSSRFLPWLPVMITVSYSLYKPFPLQFPLGQCFLTTTES